MASAERVEGFFWVEPPSFFPEFGDSESDFKSSRFSETSSRSRTANLSMSGCSWLFRMVGSHSEVFCRELIICLVLYVVCISQYLVFGIRVVRLSGTRGRKG